MLRGGQRIQTAIDRDSTLAAHRAHESSVGPILVLPEHQRDEVRLLQAVAALAHVPDGEVIVLERSAITVGEARRLNRARGRSDIPARRYWPSTKHGTNSDGGLGIEASVAMKMLLSEFGDFSKVFVSDVVGDQPALAVEFSRVRGIEVILVAEGISVLANIEKSPFVERSWKSAAGLIARDTLLEVADVLMHALGFKAERRWARRLRLSWRIRRVALLILLRPTGPRAWRLTEVHGVVTEWPERIELPIRNLGFCRTLGPEIPDARSTPEEGALLLVGQPLRLSQRTWARGLLRVREGQALVNRIVVKTHPDRRYEEEMLRACYEVFRSVDITVDRDSVAEALILSGRFEFVVAVSSTALFAEMVWNRTQSTLICIHGALDRASDPAEKLVLKGQASTIEIFRRYALPEKVLFL